MPMMTPMTPIIRAAMTPSQFFSVSSNVHNECASNNDDGGFDYRLSCKVKLQFHSWLG